MFGVVAVAVGAVGRGGGEAAGGEIAAGDLGAAGPHLVGPADAAVEGASLALGPGGATMGESSSDLPMLAA